MTAVGGIFIAEGKEIIKLKINSTINRVQLLDHTTNKFFFSKISHQKLCIFFRVQFKLILL
jgi:hypothetical protein